MKQFKGILATSHVDAHNEVMSVETLEALVDQINRLYMPIGIEHDPRTPPKGRLISAKVVPLEDGEYGVEGIGEIFEPGENYELKNDGREIPVHVIDDDKLHIQFDRNYRGEEDQEAITAIGELFDSKPQEEIKKSLDPISILTISGAFVLGGIVNGFLGKIGSDAYDYLKGKIPGLFRRKNANQDKHEALLVFSFWVTTVPEGFEVEIILTNPSPEEIEHFFEVGMHQVDLFVSQYYSEYLDIRKMSYKYEGNTLALMHMVRKDAIPMFPKEK
jgi:hypothetical protein